MELDKIAIRNSGWTWDRLREARNLGFQIGEESITDFIILNFMKLGKGKIDIKTFTKREESKTGSDWEWWFTGPSGRWLGMRVQAKVLDHRTRKFEHLHYSNKNGLQVDLLVNDARRKGMIPLYCMYTNWNPRDYTTPWKCQKYKKTVRHYGISILSSSVVKRLQPDDRKHLYDVIDELYPLHCIFCCKVFDGKFLPERAANWLHYAGLSGAESTSELPNLTEYLRREPPRYVTQLLADEFEPEFLEFNDERLKTVTVFHEISNEQTGEETEM